MSMYFERLKTLRREIRLSQSDIGEFLGITQTVYSRYERGISTIPVELLLKLADLYNVSTDYLLGRTNRRESEPGAEADTAADTAAEAASEAKGPEAAADHNQSA